jgi:gas vesicle protein
MVKDIKSGYGWIDPEYVAQTWDNSSDSIDFELVRDEIFDRLIAAGLLAHADANNPEKAGKKIKSAKELYVLESATISESATKQLADEEKFELYDAELTGKSVTLSVTSTTKTWDDGVPVLKYLARGSAKPTSIQINGSFEVAHDVARGWFYFTDGRKWYALHQEDGYNDPSDLPFKMTVKESKVEEASFFRHELEVNEDWGSSDQAAMNKSIHRDAGSPKTMPSPFDSKLRAAAEDAVDFYWDDWEEYQDDRDALIDNAVRSYLRSYFKDQFALLVRMFEGNEINENYEVIFSDGISQMKKFRSEAQAIDFMKKEIVSNKKLRDIAVYKPGMHSTTQTELVVSFWGNGSYLDNVSKKDPKLAAKKLEEAVVTEAMFKAKDHDKTLVSYAIDPKADEIYVISVAKVIDSSFPDVYKVSDKRFHVMFGMMLEDSWLKQYDKLPEVGDILPAPKKDKAFESVVTEAMFSVKDLKEPGLIWWYNKKGDKAQVTKIDKIDNLNFPRAKDAPEGFNISWGMGTLDDWFEKTGEKNPKVGEVYDIDESVVTEGVMSEIDIIAKEAKNFKEFVKAFKTDGRYKGLDDAGDTEEFEAWLQSVYDNAKMNESVKSINEGQFSWMTQDTGNQIGSEKQNTIAVTMFDDKGNKWEERSYDGYGEFGGKDYYELLAQMNGVENADRQDGIDIAFDKKKVKGKVLFPALVEDPKRFNFKKHDFTQEAEHDPNQSWYQEEEYDESATNEAFYRMSSDTVGTELYAASQALTTYYDWLQAGNDSGEGKSLDHIIDLLKKCKNSIKKFNKAAEVKGTAYESLVNEAKGSALQDYVETVSQKTFKGGGNGQNLLDEAMGLAGHIDSYALGRDTRGYEEDGFYGPLTMTAFKKLVDQMSADDIKNNQADKYESVVTEGRSINKIQKDWNQTTTDMQAKVAQWKEAEGDRKSELLDELKALTANKKALEAELEDAVAGKDKDVQLAVSEGNAFLAARAKAIEEGTEEFEFNGKTYPVIKEGNAFGAARAEAIAKDEEEFEVDGEKFQVKSVDKEDEDNAEEFVKETAEITLDSLVEKFAMTNEDLRTDVKKFIKENNKELNILADNDQWDLMYQKLYSEFGVEPDSAKGKDLLKTFQFVF